MMLPDFMVMTTAVAGWAAGGLGVKGMVSPPPSDKLSVVLFLICVVVEVLALLEWFAIRIGKEILALGVDPATKAKMFKDVLEPVQSTLRAITDTFGKVVGQ